VPPYLWLTSASSYGNGYGTHSLSGPRSRYTRPSSAWHASVDALHRSVQRWTGNPLHAVELSTWHWFSLPNSDRALHEEIRRDSVVVAGSPILLTLAGSASGSTPHINWRPAEAAARLKMARAYFETAELVATERREGFSNITAGLAILAGIAASDAICCVRVGRYHRGDDHGGRLSSCRLPPQIAEISLPDLTAYSS
jgi:hypothetical protein